MPKKFQKTVNREKNDKIKRAFVMKVELKATFSKIMREVKFRKNWKANEKISDYRYSIKNPCLATKRKKAILSKFRLSKIAFRHYLLKGFLFGVQKSNW